MTDDIMRVQNSDEKNIKRFLLQLPIWSWNWHKQKKKSGFVLTLVAPFICTAGYRNLLS